MVVVVFWLIPTLSFDEHYVINKGRVLEAEVGEEREIVHLAGKGNVRD